jgi:hypothetical protein
MGAGAIFQVVFSIASWMAKNNNNNTAVDGGRKTLLSTSMIAGFVVGMAIMYVTSLLVS